MPSSSSAAPPDIPEPIVLTYEAEGACPSQAEFFDMVRAHTTRWSPVPEGTTVARTIRVRASARTSDGRGSLTVTSTSGNTSERRVVAPSCEAVTQALAIMVAVAIDPDALSGVEPAPAPERPRPLPAPPHDVKPARALPPARPAAPRASEERARVRFSTDLQAELTSAVIDAPLPVLALAVEIEPQLWRVGALPAWLRPSLAAGLRQSLPTAITLRGGSIEFLWTAANVRLCPLRFSLRDDLVELSFCVESDLGSLRARAQGFEQARKSSIPWIDLGGSARATVALTKHVFLSTSIEAIAPYSRRRFELASGALISRAPAIGLLAGLGAGLRF